MGGCIIAGDGVLRTAIYAVINGSGYSGILAGGATYIVARKAGLSAGMISESLLERRVLH